MGKSIEVPFLTHSVHTHTTIKTVKGGERTYTHAHNHSNGKFLFSCEVTGYLILSQKFPRKPLGISVTVLFFYSTETTVGRSSQFARVCQTTRSSAVCILLYSCIHLHYTEHCGMWFIFAGRIVKEQGQAVAATSNAAATNDHMAGDA